MKFMEIMKIKKIMNNIRMAVICCEWPSPATELSARESRMALTIQ